jgi:hypothetical protein
VVDNSYVNSHRPEPLTSHRRGHWFEPITTHVSFTSLISDRLPSKTLPIRKLLEALLGPEGRRKLALREMTNAELLTLYNDDLVLRIE